MPGPPRDLGKGDGHRESMNSLRRKSQEKWLDLNFSHSQTHAHLSTKICDFQRIKLCKALLMGESDAAPNQPTIQPTLHSPLFLNRDVFRMVQKVANPRRALFPPGARVQIFTEIFKRRRNTKPTWKFPPA